MMEPNTDRDQQALEIGDEALDGVVGGMTVGPIGGGPISPIKGGGTGGGGGNDTNTPTTGGGGGFEAPKPSR